ncbi:MAG: response regulator transcription factor [Lachnospiraceae bacterium]|nr:response regulator transcription factor [Lachnospiraceae bacterium]
MKNKILVVDDEQRMRKIINDFLSKSGYKVIEACDGEEALEKFFEDSEIDLILLDIMMPRLDGWGVCKEIRKESKVPIIMLTARADESDELLGFDLGVDEYITKPFSPKILVARVEAVLRRTQGVGAKDILESAGIVMNKLTHVVTVDGVIVDFSFKEFELLEYFLENEGIALPRTTILNSVWNFDYYGEDRTIDTHVKKIRSKLGEKGKYIKTIWGIGYKFETVD